MKAFLWRERSQCRGSFDSFSARLDERFVGIAESDESVERERLQASRFKSVCAQKGSLRAITYRIPDPSVT